jgi:hypothetical protein
MQGCSIDGVYHSLATQIKLNLRCVGTGAYSQGGPRKKKKDRGSFFFKLAFWTGLTKYVIRGITIYRNSIAKYRLITSDTDTICSNMYL